jgi:hypothetical protein
VPAAQPAEPTPETAPEAVEAQQPLDAEKDIDQILAMALGKSPASKTRPTAEPGVREDMTSPMSTLLSKTKYRPK